MNLRLQNFCILLLILLFSCKSDVALYESRTSFYKNIREAAEPDSLITCLTYNIQLGFKNGNDPWDKDQTGADREQLLQLARTIRSVDPDIVSLQEVPRNRYNGEIDNFIQELAQALKMNYAFGAHGYNDPYGIYPVEGEWGNAILSKFEISAIENRETEYKSIWERRSTLMARLKTAEGTELLAYSLHFLPSPEAAPNALDFFEEHRSSQQIIMGDFNMVQVPELETAGYMDVFKQDPDLEFMIDRIYLSQPHFDIVATGTIAGSDAVSDHPANFVRIRVK